MQSLGQLLCILILKCIFFQVTIQTFWALDGKVDPINDVIVENEISDTKKNISCLPEQSFHSAADIQAIIDYVFDKYGYDEILKKSYSPEAADIHQKHLLNISDFRKWIENRPIHLKHILTELTIIRHKYVEPVVRKLFIELQENPLLELNFSHRLQKTQNLMKTVENYEMICKYNCENKQGTRVKREIQEQHEKQGYYCSSIEDLHEEVNTKLEESFEDLKSQANKEIANIDKNYGKKIEKLKDIIKNEALNKFGRTMYDILELQDNYHHFKEDFVKVNVSEESYSIKDLGLKIDAKLFNLEKSVKIYGDYCRNCNNNFVTISQLNAVKENDKYGSVSIVDALIKVKVTHTWVGIQHNLKKIFSDLEDIIIKTEDVDVYLQKLTQLKEEVTQLKDQEKTSLNNLKTLVPQTSINKLFELVKESQELLRNIEHTMQKIGDVSDPN